MNDRPRRRRGPLGRAYQIVYWLFVVGFLMSVSLSVTWHVMADHGAKGEAGAMDAPGCARGLRVLYDEVRTEASRLMSSPIPAADVDAQWVTWSRGWRSRARALRHRCPVAENADLRQLADDVERMHLAWSTAIKGFADMGRQPLSRLKSDFDRFETQ